MSTMKVTVSCHECGFQLGVYADNAEQALASIETIHDERRPECAEAGKRFARKGQAEG